MKKYTTALIVICLSFCFVAFQKSEPLVEEDGILIATNATDLNQEFEIVFRVDMPGLELEKRIEYGKESAMKNDADAIIVGTQHQAPGMGNYWLAIPLRLGSVVGVEFEENGLIAGDD